MRRRRPNRRSRHSGPDFPKAALFVGNSFFYYNNGMPGHLSFMERAADDANKAAYRNTMATIGGSGLDWHDMDNLLRPGGLGAYSFDDQNVVVFNKPGRQFDAVVMMDCSQCPIHPQLKDAFTTFAKKDSEIVRAHDMRPVLFMSWAYVDKPEMTEGLAEAYTIAGNANDALVIPAGLAFARVRKLQPELNLYAPDKRHPSPGRHVSGDLCHAGRADRPLAGWQFLHDGNRSGDGATAAEGGVGHGAGLLRAVIWRDLVGWAKRSVPTTLSRDRRWWARRKCAFAHPTRPSLTSAPPTPAHDRSRRPRREPSCRRRPWPGVRRGQG